MKKIIPIISILIIILLMTGCTQPAGQTSPATSANTVSSPAQQVEALIAVFKAATLPKGKKQMNRNSEHMDMKFMVQLVPEEEGGFSVFVPGLPGCMSQGETEEEALANIQEVIPAFLEVYNERHAQTLPNLREVRLLA